MINPSLLNPECILLGLSIKDQEEVLQHLGSVLFQHGCVKDSYVTALIERERLYPTGLGQIAIPHTDREHTIKDAIAIAILDEPVLFKMMGSDTEFCSVSVIFMLAISTNDQQIDMLQTLMGFVQDNAKLAALKGCTTKQQVYELLTQEESVCI
ncbi:PTS sugar transporter subunit IIA [Vibrio sinensis]|uniref:PTS sugar transporter subunit IIA n=1 Tax=Vibrio sinensis TaxID=2302434 RepID=A0A3A6QHN7_9VIBR|nr:PTS sugar transporter subunit IIA [Vibrio sinensis]RJX69377.1 PTS sugar transporter subunit IIA [Vibrio sinensis]